MAGRWIRVSEKRVREIPTAGAGYVMALAMTTLMFAMGYQLRDVLGEFATFLPFILAIVFAGWFGGFWPGLMATVMGGALVMFFFFPVRGFTPIESAVRGVTILVFLGIGITTSVLSEELHAARRLLESEQAKIRETEAFNEIIAELTSDFVFRSRIDDRGGITIDYASEGLPKLLGYTVEQVNVLAGGRALVHPDDREEVATVLKRLVLGESVEGEARGVAKDGRVVWLRYRMRPFLDADGQLTRVYGAASDVTEQRQADRLVRQSRDELREADRRKDEFLATLAHELRNPLAPLRNALEIMKRAGHNDPRRDQAQDIIERQVHLMVRLIDDLLDVSRITKGKLELRHERIELGTVLRDALETSRPLIEAPGHELSVVLPSEPLIVNGDPARLSQVFANLLNNAAKFTETGGRIRVAAVHAGEEVVVKIKDSGVGIPPEMLPNVFNMFTQVETGPGRSHGGLGIGLTIVKSLVEMHGGAVEARSEGRGQGSEFVVRLPAAEPAVSEQQPREAKEESGIIGWPRRRILVVDDNEDAAKTLEAFLRLEMHEVRSVRDGIEALQVARTYRPEVILLDIGMPMVNGYDVARQIREEPWGKNIILIAMTGWGQDEDKRRSKAAGFDLHLTKPFDPAALEQLLGELKGAPAGA